MEWRSEGEATTSKAANVSLRIAGEQGGRAPGAESKACLPGEPRARPDLRSLWLAGSKESRALCCQLLLGQRGLARESGRGQRSCGRVCEAPSQGDRALAPPGGQRRGRCASRSASSSSSRPTAGTVKRESAQVHRAPPEFAGHCRESARATRTVVVHLHVHGLARLPYRLRLGEDGLARSPQIAQQMACR